MMIDVNEFLIENESYSTYLHVGGDVEGIHLVDGIDPGLGFLVVRDRPSLSIGRINLLLKIVEGRREHLIPLTETECLRREERLDKVIVADK